MTARVSAVWSGFSGGPGVSQFYFPDPASAAEAGAQCSKVREYLNDLRAYFPSVVTIQVQAEVVLFLSQTGTAESVMVATAPIPVITGTGVGVYSAPSGACVTWRTAAVRFGRSVRGRTFLVPLVGTAYQSDGTLEPTALGLFRSRSTTYVTADTAPHLKPQVWARPSGGSLVPPEAPRLGGQYAMSGATVADKAAVLTSRRD